MMRFTTYVGVDAAHHPEFRLSIETWRRNRPEIWRNPLVLIVDGDLDLSFVRHPELSVVPPVSGVFVSQREKMLTSLTILPSRATTAWYLKLDTDSVATQRRPWIEEGWFYQSCLVASPWGYTKPADFLLRLDEWAETVPELAARRKPDRSYGNGVAKSKRIISYVMFGRTDWTADVVSLLAPRDRLPCPSQDTFLWYCAARLGERFMRVQMSHFGWVHCGSNFKRVRQMCQLVSPM